MLGHFQPEVRKRFAYAYTGEGYLKSEFRGQANTEVFILNESYSLTKEYGMEKVGKKGAHG